MSGGIVKPARSPRTSRARAALFRALHLAAGQSGWAAWADVRDAFRDRYAVVHRRDANPDRIRESQKRAMTRAVSGIVDHIEVDGAGIHRRIRLKADAPP